MNLIETFTDYIRNRKSLIDYVAVRKTMNERGEFNDQKLIRAEENLQRLKAEKPDLYEKMYEVLEEEFRIDRGHTVEYPIDFIRNVLKLYDGIHTPEQVYSEYRNILTHRFNDG